MDFLLELLSEEIPARMQAKARADLARLFEAELARAGLAADAIETYATPRRIALIARGLPPGTQAVREETKGPRSSAPPQALEGFLRKTGLARDQLEERDGIYFAVVEKPGRATSSVLAEAIPAIVRAFPWPKSMRWGAASLSTESLRWVRPLQGIVALLGEEIVDFEIGDVRAGAATVGHRFHHPGPITIGGAGDYVEKLRACHVVVDPAERRRIIAEGAQRLAAAAGLALVEDEGLLDENAGLTEWPVPLLGDFDPAFLDVPPEVIQLTMRTNQKYFALQSSPERGGGPPAKPVVEGAQRSGGAEAGPLHQPAAGPQHRVDHAPHGQGPSGGRSDPMLRTGEDQGSLAPAFICTANIEASDGGAAIVAGNRKVLAARLADAKFFWEQDLKIPLEQQAEKLGQIVFHEKLGTVADKVDRVAKLARWLVEEGIISSSPERGGGPPAKPVVEGALRSRGADAGPLHQPAAGPQHRVDHAPHGQGSSGGRSDPMLRTGEDQEELANLAERAARLAKADLVTGMVGEFPELQGVIGGYLARAQGEDPRVADAIRDHYKPVGQGDEVPTAPVTVAVSLADKLDTVIAFFVIKERPTGSRDPFALRRAALGAIEIIIANQLRLELDYVTARASSRLMRQWATGDDEADQALLKERFGAELYGAVPDFFVDRLKVQQRASGIRHDVIDAVYGLDQRTDDIVLNLARVKALQGFVETSEGTDLLAGYKRAANILKKEGWTPSPRGGEGRGEGARPPSRLTDAEHPHPALSLQGEGQKENKALSYTPEAEEAALIAALDSAEPRARAAVAAEDFEGAMAALASLRGPVDAFFDKVTVNDPDPAKRAARLDLLAGMRDAVHAVADFSRIEG